jgi:hypothetical protein
VATVIDVFANIPANDKIAVWVGIGIFPDQL